ncbi:MAG: PH domain-containing protein [Marinifilaceae bacterium]|jgi:hypothetical protein|nr:PH domain-containing protein [Marinilabiliaceae bacterium JC040]MCT4600592.1 PH domain-containing protein [Marinifilaceae bacterium]
MDIISSFSVTKKESTEKSENIISDILAQGESIEFAYSHIRDKVWFTNKRIIAMDVQGITGKKREFRSFPYSKISSFSIETAGTFDGDSDFKIWISGVGLFEIKFLRSIDIKEVAKYMGSKCL